MNQPNPATSRASDAPPAAAPPAKSNRRLMLTVSILILVGAVVLSGLAAHYIARM